MPKVSVVIPAYNCVKYVAQAIESVLHQTYQDFEILVVDDGSRDSTKSALSPYIKNNRIKYFFQQNQGVGAARNKGMEMAEGEYICFLDADDILTEESLGKRKNLLDKHPEIGLVFSDYDIEDRFQLRRSRLNEADFLKHFERFVGKAEKGEVIFKEDFYTKFFDFTHYPIWTGTVMIRKSVIEEVGYFRTDIRTAEDIDYWLRAAKNKKTGYINESLAVYNYYRSNLSKINTENICLKSIQKYKDLLKDDPSDLRLKKETCKSYLYLTYFYIQEGVYYKAFHSVINALFYDWKNQKCYKIILFSLPLNFLSEKFAFFKYIRSKTRNFFVKAQNVIKLGFKRI